MISGAFSVGETITGTVKSNPNVSSESPYIQFRAAVPNHKEGPHDAPTRIYTRNPYTDAQVAELALESFAGNVGQVLQAGATTAVIPSAYSSTSTIVNVDTVSLANQPQCDFYGYIQEGMILKGGTSGAEAKITNLRFVTDFSSTIQGSFFIPDPNKNVNPTFQTGERTFLLCDSPDNDPEETSTEGSDIYHASGSVNTVQENIVSVRNAKIVNIGTEESRSVSQEVGTTVETEVIGVDTTDRVISAPARYRGGRGRRNRRRGKNGGSTRAPKSGGYCKPRKGWGKKKAKKSSPKGKQGGFGGGVGNKTNRRGSGLSSRKSKKSGNKGSSSSSKGSKSRKTAGSKNKRGSGMRGRRGRRGGRRGGARDPLAQSFFISEQNGIFLTSCDVFFERVDDNGIPVTVELRTVKLGLPTNEVVPFSQVNLDPDQISTSSNGSVATKFTFESPVYLEGGTEYALVVLSTSLK